MKIALLTDGIFPYVIGGMQKHSYFLAKQLAREKHTVYLFHCADNPSEAAKLECFTDEERKYIKPFLINFPHKRYYPFHYLSESYDYSQAIMKELEPLLPETDFIFAQGFCAWALLAKRRKNPSAAKLPPVAVHFHGFEMFQDIPSLKARISRYAIQWAVKKNVNLADYSISYGRKITDILTTLVDKSKIWEVPAGVDSAWLRSSTGAAQPAITRFVFIGRYERRKGLPELNETIKVLLREHGGENFTVDFIGDIPTERRVNSPAIIYHGKISSEEKIREIVSGCDVLVCPSYAEGMPNVILEAMAQGLAVIATNAGAVSLLVDDTNGWLIDSPNPSNILEAMKRATNDKSLAGKKGKSVERIKSNFLIEDVTRGLIYKMESACVSC